MRTRRESSKAAASATRTWLARAGEQRGDRQEGQPLRAVMEGKAPHGPVCTRGESSETATTTTRTWQARAGEQRGDRINSPATQLRGAHIRKDTLPKLARECSRECGHDAAADHAAPTSNHALAAPHASGGMGQPLRAKPHRRGAFCVACGACVTTHDTQCRGRKHYQRCSACARQQC